MHRDKTVARILLILSVVHVVVAAPAIVRQRSLDVDEDVTPASEKRANPGEMPQDLSSVPQMDNEPPATSGTPASHNDQPQASGPPSSQDDTSSTSGNPESHGDPPAGSEDPQLHDAPFQSPPASGAPHLYNDPPPASGTPQLDNDPPSALGTSQLDNGPPPASGAPHLYNDPPLALGTPQLDNDPQPASGAPHPHNDAPPALGTQQLHDDPLTAPGTSSVHDDLPLGSTPFDESYRFNDFRYSPSSHESEVPPLHEPEAPPSHDGASSWASYESVAQPTNNFISEATKQRLARLVGLGAFGGLFIAFIYGVRSLSKDQSQPTGRDLTSSDVVGRGVSTHPRSPRKPVSRALANLRNQDLRLLSVLTRRALERLD